MIEINGMAHVILRVRRFAECAAFYEQLMPFLGLREVVRVEGEYLYWVGGRTAVGIRRADPAGPAYAETAPGIDHLCFRARSREDVDAVHAFLVSIGTEIVRAPEEGPWAPGYYSCSWLDPEGIRHEVNHVPGRGLLEEGTALGGVPR